MPQSQTAVHAAPGSTIASVPTKGVVVPPGGGERFEYCARPLTLWIKIDSVSAPGTQLVAGIGHIRGDEGVGRHRGIHEVVYIPVSYTHLTLPTN